MRERIIKWLEKLKKEIEKRDDIYKHGIDLINYENEFTQVTLDMITYNLFLMNKKSKRSEEQLKEEISWWLWEDVDKRYWIKEKEYNVEKAEDFIKFILEE